MGVGMADAPSTTDAGEMDVDAPTADTASEAADTGLEVDVDAVDGGGIDMRTAGESTVD